MTAPAPHPFEAILRQIAAARPGPWYPSSYAGPAGTARDSLDPYLDDLRMAGLIRLTDWQPGHGQGFTLTSEGDELLASPRQLARLAQGRLGPRPTPTRDRSTGAEFLPESWKRGEDVRDALLFASPPRVTFALIALNSIVFVIGVTIAGNRQIAKEYLDGAPGLKVWEINQALGAVTGEDVYLRGQWWRLLTACFVHIGWAHLGSNMLCLFLVGPLLERIWGSWRFLLLYLIAGLGGSCGLLLGNPFGGGAGASGAIWGILASLIGWLLLHRGVLPPDLLARAWAQLIITFVVLTWATFTVAHVSKGGHFGGGAAGLLASFPLDATRYARGGQRRLAWASLAAIPVVCLAVVELAFERGLNLGPLVRLDPIGEQIEEMAAQRAQVEQAQEFINGLVPRVIASTNAAQTVYDSQVGRLLRQAPPRRDPAAVGQALEEVVKVRSDLGGVIGALERLGPFTATNREWARAVALKYAESWETVFELAEQGLRQGPDWPTENRVALWWWEGVAEKRRLRWQELLTARPAEESSAGEQERGP